MGDLQSKISDRSDTDRKHKAPKFFGRHVRHSNRAFRSLSELSEHFGVITDSFGDSDRALSAEILVISPPKCSENSETLCRSVGIFGKYFRQVSAKIFDRNFRNFRTDRPCRSPANINITLNKYSIVRDN